MAVHAARGQVEEMVLILSMHLTAAANATTAQALQKLEIDHVCATTLNVQPVLMIVLQCVYVLYLTAICFLLAKSAM